MRLDQRLLSLARGSRALILLSISLGVAGGILGVFQARQLSRVISQVFLAGENLASVAGFIYFLLLLIALRAVSSWASDLSASAAARRITLDLRQKLYLHITHLGPAWLKGSAKGSDQHTGELVNTATEGLDALEVYFSQYLPQIALAAVIPLSILIFVFPTDTLSAVILLVTAPLLPLFMYLIGSTAEALTRRQWLGLSRMSAYFLDVIQGLTTLKSLGRSRDQVRVIEKVSENYRQTTLSVLRITFLSALALELVATLSTAVVAVEIGIRLLYGKMAFEQAFFLLILAPEFYQPLRLLGTRFHAGRAGLEAARRIFEILDIPAVENPSLTTPGVNPVDRKNLTHIELKNVSYSYSPDHFALRDISIQIPAGKTTAIVGASGAGKTTLSWLMMRFIRPQSGEILAGGVDINQIAPTDWQANLAWVPQIPYLFNDTIRANIRMSKPEAPEAAIIQAAQLAHADEFIRQLPQGYSTIIGERGVRLSAGHAQRIALARAFLKDAPLLILDEATSHLDPLADALMQASLQKLCQHRTVVIIAHQQKTLSLAHQVIWLQHGQVERTSENKYPVIAVASPTVLPSLIPPASISEGIQRIENQTRMPELVKKTSPLSHLLKLLSPFSGRILLSIFLGFATVASAVGLMSAAAYIISAAALHPSIAELQVAIVGVRFFGLSRGVFRYLERLVSHDVTFRLLARWRVWFYQALEPLAPARLLRYHSGDLLTRVISDIGTLESFYVRTVSPPLVALLVSAAVAIFLAGFGADLALTFIIFIILAGVGLPLVVFILSRKYAAHIQAARAQLRLAWVDGLQGMPDLLVNGRTGAQAEKINLAGKQLLNLRGRMDGINAFHASVSNLLANLAMLAVMTISIQRVSQGRLDGVFLGVVALAVLTSFEAIHPLPMVAQSLPGNQAALDRLNELVDTSPEVTDPELPLILPAILDLGVKDLSFQYPPWVDEVRLTGPTPFKLKNISFALPVGKHFALIGANGCGKTTLVSLLMRYWNPTSGCMAIAGEDISHYRQEDIRNCIALVPQDPYLFSGTLKENLLLARPQASTEELTGAAREAQLDDFIRSLPDGYDTWIGEHGLRLSVGARQRLAIARAFLKKASLLIFDEPTANLDPTTEMKVLNSIHRMCQDRSMIMITQHMLGLERMDEILVLDHGQIIERGTHAQLVKQQGIYSRMWELYHQLL